LLFGIICYEKYGSECKRTLINRLISLICWVTIQYICCIFYFDIFRCFIGPLPFNICSLTVSLRYILATQILVFLCVIILAKYLFVFWFKNPMAFPDDYWCYFVYLWSILYSIIAQIISHSVPGKLPVYVYLCTNTFPPGINFIKKILRNFLA